MVGKKYKIADRVFVLPDNVSQRQYKAITRLTDESMKALLPMLNTESNVAFVVLQYLLQEDKVSQALAIVLVEEGKEKWLPSDAQKLVEEGIFEDASDKDMVEIISDFFAGRLALMSRFGNTFENLKNARLQPSLNTDLSASQP